MFWLYKVSVAKLILFSKARIVVVGDLTEVGYSDHKSALLYRILDLHLYASHFQPSKCLL
jgi:hypothetical protein